MLQLSTCPPGYFLKQDTTASVCECTKSNPKIITCNDTQITLNVSVYTMMVYKSVSCSLLINSHRARHGLQLTTLVLTTYSPIPVPMDIVNVTLLIMGSVFILSLAPFLMNSVLVIGKV